MSFAVLLVTNNKNKKKILIGIVFSLFISFLSLFILFGRLFSYLGVDFVQYLVSANIRILRTVDNTLLAWLVQIIAGFFGPFPNFNRINDFEIMETGGVFLKVIISLLLWMGVLMIVKRFNYKYYPIVVYVVVNLLVVLLYGKTLDMRYQLVCLPLMLPVIAYAFQDAGKKIARGLVYYAYILFAVGIILAYNHR
jgi:hypothetical protein